MFYVSVTIGYSSIGEQSEYISSFLLLCCCFCGALKVFPDLRLSSGVPKAHVTTYTLTVITVITVVMFQGSVAPPRVLPRAAGYFFNFLLIKRNGVWIDGTLSECVSIGHFVFCSAPFPVVYLIFFHVSFVMFVWSYWKTIFTKPANPSKEVQPGCSDQPVLWLCFS